MKSYKKVFVFGLTGLLVFSFSLTKENRQDATVFATESDETSFVVKKDLILPLEQKAINLINRPFMEKQTAVVDAGEKIKEQETQALKDSLIANKQKAEAERLEKERIEEERLIAIAKEEAAELERQEQIAQELEDVRQAQEAQVLALEKEKQEALMETENEKTTIVTQPVVEQKPETVDAPKETSVNGQSMTVQATAYSTNQPSLGDTTATGINLNQNPNVIAVDPSFIPLGSTIHIEGYGTFIAGDTGSDIVGNRIDIHMTDLSQAVSFGRKSLTLTIIQ